MSELTLDFTDASFDADVDTYIIDPSDNLVFEMNADGSVGAPLVDRETGENIAEEDPAGIGAISSMAISAPPGSTFDFEFIDNPDDEDTSNEDVRSSGDQYAMRADVSANGVTLFMNEAMFEGNLQGQTFVDVVNGGTMEIKVDTTTVGAPTTRVEPVDVVDGDGALGTLGYNNGVWLLDINEFDGQPSYSEQGSWLDVSTHLMGGTIGGQPSDAFADPAVLLASMTSPVPGEPVVDGYSFNIGDGAGETWVVSGDLNGRDPAEWEGGDLGTNDTIGFRPGTFDGVFLGGDGFDTLRFDHNNSFGDMASWPTKMFVDLSSGTAMFGNGQESPFVQFAEVGGEEYALDWERLELVGESSDTVIVGDGIGLASDNQGLTSTGDAIVDGFFELALGGGEDQVFVNDTSTGITLDLAGSELAAVYLTGEDGMSVAQVMHGDPEGAPHFIGMVGEGEGGVVDYLNAGDNQDLWVDTSGEYGVVVNFGLDEVGEIIPSREDFIPPIGEDLRPPIGEDFIPPIGEDLMPPVGEDNVAYGPVSGEDAFVSGGENDVIDLRGMDYVEVAGEASDAQISVAEGVTFSESGDVEFAENSKSASIRASDVEAILVTQSGDDADTDVLVDMSHLYGEDAGVLGLGVEDHSGGTYDVKTSATLEEFASETDLQVYYDGDHNAFVDSDDDFTWTSTTMSVGVSDGVTDEQKGWAEAVVANDSGGAATPSFYVEISGQKVAVYLDQTDSENVEWKVDTTAFAITSDADIGGQNAESALQRIEDAYGVSIEGAALDVATSVYLNASESDIQRLLAAGDADDELGTVMSESAYDFGFYTQVQGTDANGDPAFVNVALDYNEGGWSVSADSLSRVKTDYNTVSNDDGSAAIGGSGSDFVELGGAEVGSVNFAMGNGGDDTYQVDAGDSGIINELGDLDLLFGERGSTSNSDAVQFELVNSIDELTFTRTKIAGEKDGSTLQIDAGESGSATLFDQYNDFLSFRKTEYLVIDDGATHNEVFSLVTDGNDTGDWANGIYVAHEDEAMSVDLGGLDYVFLGDDEANEVTVDIDQILSSGSGSVSVSGIEGDNLVVTGKSVDGAAVEAAYNAVKSDADSATISWEEVNGSIEVSINVLDEADESLLAETVTMEYMV